MEQLPHVMLVGEGAARFAREVGAETPTKSAEGFLSAEVREGWEQWLRDRMSPQQWDDWPAECLAPWARLTADPETAHGTVCMLARDGRGDIASGVSTSGWAWKYPGRLGDSPIIGAGNYADNRLGAAACTGFGEMAIRTSAARSVLLYLKMGMSIKQATLEAATDLHETTWYYKGRVTIYAFDQEEQYRVLSYTRAGGESSYWIWTDGMERAQRCLGETYVGKPGLP
jgi:L-asparaginase